MASTSEVKLLIGTKKGGFTLSSNAERNRWEQSDPIFLGHIIHHFISDPRDSKVCLMAAKTGHLGPTVFRSLDGGANWKEASKPPAFAATGGDTVANAESAGGPPAVDRVFWLTPGHTTEKHVWYAGTAPAGLFRSQDDGDTWEPVDGFNDHPSYKEWTSIGPTPDGQFLHSINIHPQNPQQMYLGISVGGVFESTDGGKQWAPLNQGCAADFLPDATDFGHDPHCLVVHPKNPDRLYQQNHCGLYRMDRPDNKWKRIGDNMPREIGDIGFPIVVHPTDPDTAWVFPMDGTTVWPRTSPGGKPAVYKTTDGGESWQRKDSGLPPAHGYFTVKRQCMTCDTGEPIGLYFGTTAGEVWASKDGGESWTCVTRHLPEIYSLHIM
jgi:photosystem II stability/assembly factor-like uncharacterized protein